MHCFGGSEGRNAQEGLSRRDRGQAVETFERNRDALDNNAFGEDLTSISSKEREGVKRRFSGVELLRD